MADLVVKFTEKSNDVNNYNKIHANLKVPYTQYSTLVIDSITTTACFEVLNKDDYIVINDAKINLTDSYSSLNSETVSTMINNLLNVNSIAIVTFVDNTNRIVFVSDNAFIINDCSYRLAQVLGLYDMTFPINSLTQVIADTSKNIVQCLSVGTFLTTPILYLLASIGEKCLINSKGDKRILMRINNSYSANFPVIANNAEFSTYALSNDFSDITFELVDANFKPVKLLAPLYLCGTITGDPKAETINTSILITPELINNLSLNNSAANPN